MMDEYRALRASAIRLWVAKTPQTNSTTVYEQTRFNGGIDQVLSESHLRLDRSRELLMSIHGHDERNPLNVIIQSAEVLKRHPDLTSPTLAPASISPLRIRTICSSENFDLFT